MSDQPITHAAARAAWEAATGRPLGSVLHPRTDDLYEMPEPAEDAAGLYDDAHVLATMVAGRRLRDYTPARNAPTCGGHRPQRVVGYVVRQTVLNGRRLERLDRPLMYVDGGYDVYVVAGASWTGAWERALMDVADRRSVAGSDAVADALFACGHRTMRVRPWRIRPSAPRVEHSHPFGTPCHTRCRRWGSFGAWY